ncbi:MAG: NAD(P)H-dependent oxidoreductase [Chlamydiales bacterium]|nr:NAD(P)H-dependent oxidoreductase [Chlamydiia bacterium]MCP5507525.1 NAD(P)H-dependent oxidoreductase [Chlamydiales bacterium]
MEKWIFVLLTFVSANLCAEKNVLAISGSTRNESLNKKLVTEAAYWASQSGGTVIEIDLKEYAMPFYDGDLEISEGMPEKAQQLRALMIQSDVILIASPEYNCSVSAVLKNAIDWASRSEEGRSSRAAFKDKTFVIMSASPGSGGGARGLVHLKEIIKDIGGTVLQQQVVVPNAYRAFDQQGRLIDPTQKSMLQEAVHAAMKAAS